MNSTSNSKLPTLILIAGDLLILIGFVFAGQREHNLTDSSNPLWRLALVAGAFAGPWLIAGWLLGAFRLPAAGERGIRPYSAFLARGLNSWLVAAPLGALLRAFAIHEVIIVVIFLVVTLSLGGALLIAWRLAFALMWGRMKRSAIN